MKPTGFALKKVVLQALVLAVVAGASVSFADPSGPRTLDGGFACPIPLSMKVLRLH